MPKLLSLLKPKPIVVMFVVFLILIGYYLFMIPATSNELVQFTQNGNQVSIKIDLEGTEVPRYNRITNVGDNSGDMRNLDNTIQFGGTTTVVNLPTHFTYTSITITLIINEELESEVAQIWFKDGIEWNR